MIINLIIMIINLIIMIINLMIMVIILMIMIIFLMITLVHPGRDERHTTRWSGGEETTSTTGS